MSAGQQIGDPKGAIIHIWQSDLWQRILERNPIQKDELDMGIDLVDGLPQEVLAGTIATEVYEGSTLELGNPTLKIILEVVRFAATKVESALEDRMVGYFGEPKYWLPQALSVGYLARIFDRGITPGQLQHLGISDQVIVQLMWWQRREGESLLAQQVRAELAGWCLPAIAAGYREVWGNLFRFLEKSEGAASFKEFHAEALAEISEVLTFFGNPVELSAEAQAAWANAFKDDLEALLPDIYGQFSHFPKQVLAKGVLRQPLTTLARYLELRGVTSEQFASDATLLAAFTRDGGVSAA